MKIEISIPDKLFSAADTLAENLGISRSQLYQRAIHQFLAQKGNEAVTVQLNKIYGENSEYSPDPGGLDPAVEFLQEASLVMNNNEEDW